MNKVRETLIHWLGGFTKEEYLDNGSEAWDRGFECSLESARMYAKSLYGLNAEEWCKKMYEHLQGSTDIDKEGEGLTEEEDGEV